MLNIIDIIMIDLSLYITKDGDHYYFDTEHSIDTEPLLPPLEIEYEDGDIIKWKWDGKKMFGTLRYIGPKLFKIEKIKTL